ncbi:MULTISPECIES: tRNA (5-methylaminomethyl-2-thiouridine)(34)-methyltransferase MnmD [Aerosakkonema]|uniref:tRNA (5-methylaminomethyl-2-thiouridine)(34)-methyltransferase MnmD n=1 Tax=Aerosakkonema TaxID=1246629 RepID=UPI0035B88F1E
MAESSIFSPLPTEDGSFTFFSAEFGETFHSASGAIEEAELKFVNPVQLRSKAVQPSLRLLDICYGLGYNTAAALAAIWEVNPSCRVELMALELDPRVPKAAIAHNLTDTWLHPIPQILAELAADRQVKTTQLQANLLIGDARITIEQICPSFQADAIFLDPFSPPKSPQLWTVEFLGLVAKCLKPEGILATYSCSAAVRSALMAANLQIGSAPPVGRRSPGTVAARRRWQTPSYLPPLSQQELEHLQTRAAIPYRDPNLCDRAETIVLRRKIEQGTSSLESTAQWKKRWLSTQK